jgi:hypothetical protein
MPELKLNRKLNLVMTVDTERGTLHVVAQPIPRAVFEDNFMIMCRAYAAIYNNQLGPITGPQAALMLIKREAQILGEETKGDMLLNEIRRMINVLVPSTNGSSDSYQMMDFGLAVRQKLIDEDSAADIEAAVCFFTLALRAGAPQQMEGAIAGLNLFWNAETTSLTLTEYMRSLPTLTKLDVMEQKDMINLMEAEPASTQIPQ